MHGGEGWIRIDVSSLAGKCPLNPTLAIPLDLCSKMKGAAGGHRVVKSIGNPMPE